MTTRNKNILFYSVDAYDKMSKEILEDLEKNKILKNQFIYVCINDKRIHIPEKIKNINKIPILVISGINTPIVEKDAVSWIKNSFAQENVSDIQGCFANKCNFSLLKDDNNNSSEYNKGYSYDDVVNSGFTDIDKPISITTYKDDATNDKKADFEASLNRYKQTRDADIPKPRTSVIGFDMNNTNTNKKHISFK